MTVGIAAEYNPFHNGHKYHIEQAKYLTGADTAAVVMSGSFVQRGEPAMCSKWARAGMALKNGADLVVELPVCYAVRSAQFFAEGAVAILKALNVGSIAFGAETDDMEKLRTAADILKNESSAASEDIKKYISQGMSYPSAISKAYPDYADIISEPNNILAIEYIKAGAENPVAIIRNGAGHDGEPSGEFASASYIRTHLAQAGKYMPHTAYDILMREINKGACPPNNKSLSDIVLARLRGETAENLKKICDVSEGIENRILSAAKTCINLDELYDAVKTKRFTHARIRRIVINYALGITKKFVEVNPQYIRVLASNEKGFALLRNCSLPVVTKTAGFENDVFEREVFATDLYSLLLSDEHSRRGNKDYTTPPVIEAMNKFGS